MTLSILSLLCDEPRQSPLFVIPMEAMENDYLKMARDVAARGYFWTQGAGGNISVKQGDVLSIKPSGVRLDSISLTSEPSRIDLKAFAKGLTRLENSPSEEDYANLIQTTNLQSSPRASMETGFHAALEFKYVAHFHSLIAVLLSHEFFKNRERVQSWMREQKFETKFGAYQFLPLALPGMELSLQILKQKASLFFLEQHGIIWASDRPLSFDEFWDFENEFCKEFDYSHSLKLRLANQHLERAPLRFYFPDFCILFPKLAPFLKPCDGGELELSSECTDLNLREIWWSHCFLFHSQPHLNALPNDYVEAVAKLPTEVLRKKILNRGES